MTGLGEIDEFGEKQNESVDNNDLGEMQGDNSDSSFSDEKILPISNTENDTEITVTM